MTGHERRAAATKEAIKDTMLDLLKKTAFNDISISLLCREAGVGRATFYTHYNGLTDVIDELADDAIDATKRSKAPGLSGVSILLEKMRTTMDPAALAPYMELLPVCQRVADQSKYRPLFFDEFLSDYMMMRIFRRERELMLPYFMENSGMTPMQAEKVFLFGIAGAYAVNRSMNWKKDADWYEVQKVLLTFLEGGDEALKKL